MQQILDSWLDKAVMTVKDRNSRCEYQHIYVGILYFTVYGNDRRLSYAALQNLLQPLITNHSYSRLIGKHSTIDYYWKHSHMLCHCFIPKIHDQLLISTPCRKTCARAYSILDISLNRESVRAYANPVSLVPDSSPRETPRPVALHSISPIMVVDRPELPPCHMCTVENKRFISLQVCRCHLNCVVFICEY